MKKTGKKTVIKKSNGAKSNPKMQSKQRRVYLDFASAAPVDARVIELMRNSDSGAFANPDSVYAEGMATKKISEDARAKIAGIIGASSSEVIFTSGATESNNLAILGVFEEARRAGIKMPHIITSSIEHKSILSTAREAERRGGKVTFVDPDERGLIDPKKIYEAICPDTVLVSIGYANGETGAIEPVADIARAIRRFKKNAGFDTQNSNVSRFPYLHTDAAQAANYLDINVLRLNVDLMTLSSPKVRGPAGVGILYKKRTVNLLPIIFGGGQENGLRSGRSNAVLEVGFAKALELAQAKREAEGRRLRDLSALLLNGILKIEPKAMLNGPREERLSNNVNVCIPGLDSEYAVIALDHEGVACSSSSACMSNDEDSYSYVVEKISPGCGRSSLRFTLGASTKKSDIDFCLKAFSKILFICNQT